MNARPPAAEISHFVLFGEQAGDDDPEFIHIEEIRTRSSLYDWQITPHRHRRMFQFLYTRLLCMSFCSQVLQDLAVP